MNFSGIGVSGFSLVSPISFRLSKSAWWSTSLFSYLLSHIQCPLPSYLFCIALGIQAEERVLSLSIWLLTPLVALTNN